MKTINQNELDYMTELDFAKKYLKGDIAMSQFCYMKDYQKTIQDEATHIVGNKVLFIGAGPLPLSLSLFAKKGFVCDGLDYSKEAVTVGKKVLRKMGHTDTLYFHADARTFDHYASYDTIILALEAGVDEVIKKEIFKKISKETSTHTKILVRSSNLQNTEGSYVNSKKYVSHFFSIKNIVPTFSGYCSTFVCV